MWLRKKLFKITCNIFIKICNYYGANPYDDKEYHKAIRKAVRWLIVWGAIIEYSIIGRILGWF